jgi:hypothetical protein
MQGAWPKRGERQPESSQHRWPPLAAVGRRRPPLAAVGSKTSGSIVEPY